MLKILIITNIFQIQKQSTKWLVSVINCFIRELMLSWRKFINPDFNLNLVQKPVKSKWKRQIIFPHLKKG